MEQELHIMSSGENIDLYVNRAIARQVWKYALLVQAPHVLAYLSARTRKSVYQIVDTSHDSHRRPSLCFSARRRARTFASNAICDWPGIYILCSRLYRNHLATPSPVHALSTAARCHSLPLLESL